MLKCSSEPVSERPTVYRWNSNFSGAICLRPNCCASIPLTISKLTTYSPKAITDRGRPAKGDTQVRMAIAIVRDQPPTSVVFSEERLDNIDL